MKWVPMRGEGKIAFKIKSRIKWVGLAGLVLSTFSIFTHFLLARYTDWGVSEYQASVTIFSWRPSFQNADLSTNVMSLNPLKILTFFCAFLYCNCNFAFLFSYTSESFESNVLEFACV